VQESKNHKNPKEIRVDLQGSSWMYVRQEFNDRKAIGPSIYSYDSQEQQEVNRLIIYVQERAQLFFE